MDLLCLVGWVEILLAVDPGADSGWALFVANLLTKAGLNIGALDTPAGRVTIERPMIYPGARQKARPADVIKLAVRAGEWGGSVRTVWGTEPEYIEPHTWKGQLSKETCHTRIWALLEPDEQNVVGKACKGVAPAKRHNVMDAVGIGLWALKRWVK